MQIEEIEDALTLHDCHWAIKKMLQGHEVRGPTNVSDGVRVLRWRISKEEILMYDSGDKTEWFEWGTISAWEDPPRSGRTYALIQDED